jgi:hypothetical protein
MAVTIDKAAVKTFENNVRFTAQQMESFIRPWCQEHSGPSAAHSFKVTGARTLSAVNKTRRQATPINDQVWSNRVAIPYSRDDGEVIEGEDKVKMIIDPTSTVVQSMGYAVKRFYDDYVIAAADANALDEDSNVNAFPAAQYYDGSAAYADEIDAKVVTHIANKFATNEVPDEEPKVALIGPNQVEKLLHETKVGSVDYNTLKPLQSGKLVEWAGFTWIRTNRLLKPQAGQVKCIFMTRKAMGLLVLEDLFARVSERSDLSYATQAYVRVTAGAVRVQDEQIVVARLKDTVTLA